MPLCYHQPLRGPVWHVSWGGDRLEGRPLSPLSCSDYSSKARLCDAAPWDPRVGGGWWEVRAGWQTGGGGGGGGKSGPGLVIVLQWSLC